MSAILAAVVCVGAGSVAACGDDEIIPGDQATPDAASTDNMAVSMTEPAESAELEAGGEVTVAWVDADGEAGTIELFADADGDLLTPEFQVRIAVDLPEGDGSAQMFVWDTVGIPPGSYRLVAKSSNGTTATAPGTIAVTAAAAPQATIQFPPSISLTDAAAITLRGTSSDATGTQSVTVAGLLATSDDGFKTWVVTDIPLSLGSNVLTVGTRDSLGNANSGAAMSVITRSAAPGGETTGGGAVSLADPKDIALDAANDRLLVVDDTLNAVVGVDRATGNRSVVSNAATGAGALALSAPVSIVVDQTRALVADADHDVVFDVALDSGDRTVINDGGDGEANGFGAPGGFVRDDSVGRLLLCETNDDSILGLALADGVRTIVSSDVVGTGDPFSEPRRVALDAANNRAYVVNHAVSGSLMSVDLAAGNRKVVSDGFIGAGLPVQFRNPVDLALDLPNNRALVQITGDAVLTAINLTTGDRTPVSSSVVGRGPGFDTEESIAYDQANQIVYVLDSGLNAVFAVDLSTGDRVLLSK